jgi:hypothetical protein
MKGSFNHFGKKRANGREVECCPDSLLALLYNKAALSSLGTDSLLAHEQAIIGGWMQ